MKLFAIKLNVVCKCVIIQCSLRHNVAAAVTKLLGICINLQSANGDVASSTCTTSSVLTPKRRITVHR